MRGVETGVGEGVIVEAIRSEFFGEIILWFRVPGGRVVKKYVSFGRLARIFAIYRHSMRYDTATRVYANLSLVYMKWVTELFSSQDLMFCRGDGFQIVFDYLLSLQILYNWLIY